MKSLASTQCAGRLFAGLVAISSLLLLGACGSSSSGGGNQQGFSNSSLSGTYVFSSTGSDSSSGAFVAIAGAITADGNGNITAGNVDVIDPNFGVGSGMASGKYAVNQDGTGSFTVAVANVQSFTFQFVLSSTSHGLVTEFDSFGSGSGTLDLQTALTGVSQLALPYAVSLTGTDTGGQSVIASAGSITFNTSGTSTAGIQDINDNGVPILAQAFSGTVTLGSGTAPGQMTISDAFGASSFDFYPIDQTHFKVIETDGSQAYLAGDFCDQTGAVIPTGQVVFTMAGFNGSGPIADGGFATAAANGNFTAGEEDLNLAGTITPQISFSGTGSSGSGSDPASGRTIVGLTSFEPASQWIIYPTASAGVIMLESDGSAVMLGAAYAQSASPSISVSQGFAFNLTGFNLANSVEVDDTVQFNTTSSASASPNMSGTIYENQNGLQSAKGTFTAVYTPDSNSSTTGRGNILTSQLVTLNGGFGLEYYVVDSTTVLFIEGNSSDNGQVAVGSFVQQTTPMSPAAIKHPVVAIMHPVNHAHGAARNPQKWNSNRK